MQTTLPISSTIPAKKFEYDLEGLRGFAALLVVWCHAIGFPTFLDPAYTSTGIIAYQPPAHFCVLIFFVLSGYVIGLSTKGRITTSNAATYIKKRVVRIYPIYFISMLAALAVAIQPYSLRTILGSFAFLQILLTPVIEENGASWSLQYEMLYYLLFIPFSFGRVNPLLSAMGCFLFGLVMLHFAPVWPLPASYAFGFCFWCCGWALSRYAAGWKREQSSYTLLLSTLLLFFSFRDFNYLGELLDKSFQLVLGNGLGYEAGLDPYKTMLAPHDFSYLPYAVVGVLLFTHKRFPFRTPILAVLFLLPALTFVHIWRYWPTLDKHELVMPAASYLLGLALFLRQSAVVELASKQLMYWLVKIGSVSYGLYIIHMPLLWLFKRVHLLSGSPLTYWVRFALFMALALALATFLEKRFHPFIKRLTDRPMPSLYKPRLLLAGMMVLVVAGGYAFTQRKVGLLWTGNSLIYGANVTRAQVLPTQAHNLLGPEYRLIANTGVSGWHIKLLYENREEKIGQYLNWRNKLRYRRIVVLVEEGINGIGGGDVSVAEYKVLWTKLCDYIVERGGTPIIITNTPAGNVDTYAPYYAKNKAGSTQTVAQLEAQRQEIIAWQRSNWQNTLHALGIVDLNQVPGMGSVEGTANSLLFQPDRVHPTAKGYEVEAAYCAPKLAQLLSE